MPLGPEHPRLELLRPADHQNQNLRALNYKKFLVVRSLFAIFGAILFIVIYLVIYTLPKICTNPIANRVFYGFAIGRRTAR